VPSQRKQVDWTGGSGTGIGAVGSVGSLLLLRLLVLVPLLIFVLERYLKPQPVRTPRVFAALRRFWLRSILVDKTLKLWHKCHTLSETRLPSAFSTAYRPRLKK
jgi:hypothetical protein